METRYASSVVEEMAQLADERFHSGIEEQFAYIDDILRRYPEDVVETWALVTTMYALQSVTVLKGVAPTRTEVKRLVGPAMVVVWNADEDEVSLANELTTDLAKYLWGKRTTPQARLATDPGHEEIHLMVRIAIAVSVRVAIVEGLELYGDPIRRLAVELDM